MTDPTSGTGGSASVNASAHGGSGSSAAKNSKAKKTKAAGGASKSKRSAGSSSHPKYSAMIKQALTQLNDRNGTSKAAILKYIVANYKIAPNTANQHLKVALRAGTKNNTLKQTKCTGASGSFKLVAASKKAATGGKKKKAASGSKGRSRSRTSKAGGATKTKAASGTKAKKARS